jgi:hypothetical protein
VEAYSMRNYPVACSTLFALALAACGSSPKDNTEIVVTVWSDLAVPTEMDAVRIRVSGLDQDMDQLFPLSADKRTDTYQIPLQVPVLPGTSTNRTIRVAAVASHQGTEIVLQEAVSGFVFGEARELVLSLARRCENLSCTGSGFTCDNGACVRPLVVDPATLPTYVPGQASPSSHAGGAPTGGTTTGAGGVAGTGGGGNTRGSGGIIGAGGIVVIRDAGPDGWATGGSITGSGGITGTGGSVGTVKVDQAVLVFGSVDIGTASTPKTVTVTVSGAPATLNATVTGTGFAISANNCLPKQPIGTCTISVVFAPTLVGAASGSLAVGPVVVALSGTATQPGIFTLTPDTFPLGTLLVGASTPVTVSIVPVGTLPSLACLASGADLTLATQTCPITGPVSVTCSYTFTFKAASAGQKAESIVCSGGSTVKTASVTANIVTPPALLITPSKQAFSAKVGQSTAWTFNVSNAGGSQTGILSAAITGAGFSITANDCPPQLAGSGICKVQVTFAPNTGGAVTGSLTVTDSTPGSTPAAAALTGTGLVSQPTITPAAKDFGTVTVGQAVSTTFTMANSGSAATGIIALASTDTQFTIGSDLCSGRALEVKGQCSFGVTFAPASVGLTQAMVNASQTSDGAVLASVALTGTGKAGSPGSGLSMTPASLDFGATTVGASVGPLFFTITNIGAGTTGTLWVLKNDSLSSVGGAAQFTTTGDTCATAVLAPEGSCRVGVTFAPMVAGVSSTTFQITDGGVLQVSGNVTGTTVSISGLSAAPACEEF